MDFLNKLLDGVAKSQKALAAIIEVDSVFDKINDDLGRYPNFKLSLVRDTSTLAGIASFASWMSATGPGAQSVEQENLAQNQIVLKVQVGDLSYSEVVAGWKQRVSGYPCVLKFEGQELSCSNQNQLLNGFAELLSTVSFGNVVNKLLARAVAATEKKAVGGGSNNEFGEAASASASRPAVPKPAAAKPAKPASKPAAAKSKASKPAAAKPKPAAAKPKASKPSEKPPA